MAEPMSYVDAYREALGLDGQRPMKAPSGWMTGEVEGYTKYEASVKSVRWHIRN